MKIVYTAHNRLRRDRKVVKDQCSSVVDASLECIS